MTQFDPAAATAAYMAQLSPAAHARATAYTQGGHWLLLWGWLVGVLVALLILRSGLLVAVARGLQRRRPRPWLVAFLIGLLFTLTSWVLGLPWSIYADWWRERRFGLTSRPLAGWLGEQAASELISAGLGAVFLMVLYALIRRAPRTWWAWAGGLTALALAFMLLIGPTLIEPIFNRYTPAPPGQVRDAVVALAKVSGVPSDKIYIYDGSKQSNRYTANVSGLGGSARVAMSDVMFKKGADLAEVRGVVGHEMGHYAHLHGLWFTIVYSLLAVTMFWLTQQLFPLVQRWLHADAVQGIGDPTGLPVLAIIVATLSLLATPLTNTITRATESDADRFSLEHAHEPDGLSKALVKTIEYRASSPGPVEEFVFYDHPSVERRVRRAMDWKAAHLPNPPA